MWPGFFLICALCFSKLAACCISSGINRCCVLFQEMLIESFRDRWEWSGWRADDRVDACEVEEESLQYWNSFCKWGNIYMCSMNKMLRKGYKLSDDRTKLIHAVKHVHSTVILCILAQKAQPSNFKFTAIFFIQLFGLAYSFCFYAECSSKT